MALTPNTKFATPNCDLNALVKCTLQQFGFRSDLKGFDYMVRATEMIYNDPSKFRGIVKNVYIPISEEYGVNHQCVERNCRTLLQTRWSSRGARDDFPIVLTRAHNGKCVPPLKEFLYILCDHLSNTMEENSVLS